MLSFELIQDQGHKTSQLEVLYF